MLFGDKSEFAIEVIPDPEPTHFSSEGMSGGRMVATGRVRVWMAFSSFGDLQEPQCCLGTVANELADMLVGLDNFWHPSFAGQTAEELFDTLDRLLFAAHRGPCLEESLDRILAESEAMRPALRSFMTNSSEAFDRWKAFLVKPPGNVLHVLWTSEGDVNAIRRSVFDARAYKSAVSAFANWTDTSEWRSMQKGLE